MYFCVISTLVSTEEYFFFVCLFYVCRKMNGFYCKSELIKRSMEPFLLPVAPGLIEIMSDNRKNGSFEKHKPVASAYVSTCLV